MRIIKFRAWNKKTSSMLPWQPLLAESRIVGEILDGRRADNYELMQFTGLKDKTGKEIYEGDVLELQRDFLGHIGEVFWCDMNGRWEIKKYKHLPFWKDVCYIIGNIYENPELLTRKDTNG